MTAQTTPPTPWRRILRLTMAAVLCLALVAGCGSDDDDDADAGAVGAGQSVSGGTTAPCTPPPTIDAAQATPVLPAGITLPDPSQVLLVGATGDGQQVSGQSALGVTPLKDHFVAVVKAAGGTVTKQEDEGREAEVNFTLTDGKKGEVRISRAPCPADTRRFTIAFDTK